MAVLATVIVFTWFGGFCIYAWEDLRRLAAEQEREALLDQLWDEAA